MEIKPLKMTVNHSDLPEEMLLFRDFEMIDDFIERFPGVNVKRLGRLAISLFRGNEDYPDASENDYFGIGVRDEDTVRWHLFFEHYPQMAYFAGIALGAERQRDYHEMLRYNDFKTFGEKFGWWAQVVIDELPTDAEKDAFCEWLLSKQELDEEWVHFNDSD